MFSPRSVMALLVMVALSAKAAESAIAAAESAIAAPDLCSEADVALGGFCLTCKTKAKCGTADSPPEPKGDCTVPGEACTVLSGVATCKPTAETVCSCDSPVQCDPYDPDFVLICSTGGDIISIDCSETENETCDGGVCGAFTTTPSPADVCADPSAEGFVVLTPLCTTAAYCHAGENLEIDLDCNSGEYFDMDKQACATYPPVPCDGCDSGACPDKSDCSKYYICGEGGTVLDEETCEAPTPDFDTVLLDCVAEGTGTCTGNDNCTYGSMAGATTVATSVVSSSDGSSTDDGSTTGDGGTTGGVSDSTTNAPGSTDDSTTTTSRPAECTAENVGQQYPFEGNCKMYWACLQVGTAGHYAYVQGICPGNLLFNPDKGYCDIEDNVDCDYPASVFF